MFSLPNGMAPAALRRATDRCVVGRDVALQDSRSAGAGITLHIDDIFDADGDSSERQRNVSRFGFAQGGLKIPGQKGLHGWVHRLDSRFERTQEINRVKGFGTKTFLNFGSGEAGEIHHSTTFGTMTRLLAVRGARLESHFAGHAGARAILARHVEDRIGVCGRLDARDIKFA